MPRASQSGKDIDARAERIQEVILDCLQRRNLGEEVSDESVAQQHADLMPELAEDLHLLGALDEAAPSIEEKTTDEPSSVDPPHAPQRGLSLHCPHCRHAIRISVDTPFTDITCSVCGSHFSLVDDGQEVIGAQTGKCIAHFELIERLGVGSFGTVWKAQDTKLDRTVAVKVPRQRMLAGTEVEQFLREARAAAQLNHPNIVSVHEVGRDSDMVYIVCDYVPGVPLSEWLRHQRPTFRRAAELCVNVAYALHHAHEAGIVHRDLKPQNIMVDAEGQPHLMDFGLARREAGETTMTIDGQVLGTPAYMSPEQARGESHRADRRTDVYSLGVVLFELLSGELPFRGTARMMIQQVLYEEPSGPRRLNSTVPKDLDTIVLKAMAKEPHRRYATASQLGDDLQRYLDGNPIVARRTGPLDHLWRWAKRQPAIASLAATVLALLVFLSIAGPLVAWKQRTLTDQQRLFSEQQRRQLYVSDVNTAHHAWREANLDRARQLLARHQPRRNEEDLRGFEWYYLWAQLENVALTPKLDHHDVRSVAISPDGKLMATGGRQPAIKLWDVRAPQPKVIMTLAGDKRTVTGVAFSPDGQTLAASSNDRTVTLWDVLGGSCIDQLDGHSGGVKSVAFSPDGRTLASASSDGTVKLWDVAVGTERMTLARHRSTVNIVVFSPDGQTLASGSDDETVQLWDVQTGQPVRDLDHRHGVCAAAFSPDGKLFACGGLGNDIKLWDMPTGDLHAIVSVPAHHKVESLAFSSDCRTLASGGRDKTVMLWDTASERHLGTIRGHTQDVTSVTFSADDQTLAAASLDGSVKLWDVYQHVVQYKFTRGGWAVPVAFSPDGRTLAMGTGLYFMESQPESGDLRVFDVRTGATQFAERQAASIRTLAFSPNGKVLATGGGHVPQKTGEIKLWDAATGTRLMELERRMGLDWTSGVVLSVAFSPNGKMLAAGGGYSTEDGDLKVWDVATGRPLPRLKGDRGRPVSIAFSPDGTILASGGYKKIILWDVNSGKQLKTLDGSASILSLAFSPDGSTLATGGNDDIVRLWDVRSRTQRHVLSGHSVGVLAVAFSPDGKTLASGSVDNTVRLWQTSTGDELATLESPAAMTWLAFSPDGRTLAGGAVGKRVILWHAESTRRGWPLSLR